MTDARYGRWLAEAVEAFGLDERARVRPLPGGTANVSFVVEAAEQVIVTFCPDLTLERVERLTVLLEHLLQHGVATNRLLRSRAGGLVHVVDGVPTIVKVFIDGRALSVVDEPRAHRIGGVLASLHEVPAPAGFAADHAMNREVMVRLAEAAADSSFSDWLVSGLEELPPDWEDLPAGLVHGDLAPDNLIETPDGRLVPIDFEEACLHPFVFDVGMSLVNLANVDSLSRHTAAALLAGYAAGRELSPAECSFVPVMLEYSALMTACWRYELSQREGPVPGELRKWGDAQATHARSLEWRRTGVWSTLLGWK